MLSVLTAELLWNALLAMVGGEVPWTHRYLPVPVWNNRIGQWEPLDFRQGQRVAAWPGGFDLARLPVPDYRDGDRVQFVRDETCAREGVVRMVLSFGSWKEQRQNHAFAHPVLPEKSGHSPAMRYAFRG